MLANNSLWTQRTENYVLSRGHEATWEGWEGEWMFGSQKKVDWDQIEKNFQGHSVLDSKYYENLRWWRDSFTKQGWGKYK